MNVEPIETDDEDRRWRQLDAGWRGNSRGSDSEQLSSAARCGCRRRLIDGDTCVKSAREP